MMNGAYGTPRKLEPTLCPLMLTKCGKSKSDGAISLATREPMPGWTMPPDGPYPVCNRYVARPWLPSLDVIERMTAKSRITPAVLVQCSAMAIPGADVPIALVGPWFSAPGLGSKVSNWLGPPAIQSKMQALCDSRNSSA